MDAQPMRSNGLAERSGVAVQPTAGVAHPDAPVEKECTNLDSALDDLASSLSDLRERIGPVCTAEGAGEVPQDVHTPEPGTAPLAAFLLTRTMRVWTLAREIRELTARVAV